MKSSPYREWLLVSFGLAENLPSKRPKRLREEAAKIAGDNDPHNFGRTGGKEQQGLAALAAQIVADCLQDHDQHAVINKDIRSHKNLIILAVISVLLIGGSAIYGITENPIRQSSGNLAAEESLAVTFIDLTDNGSGWSIAFPSGRTKAIPQFLDRVDRNEPAAAFFDHHADSRFLDDALDAGAYVLGKARLQIELEGDADRDVTIYNVRIVPVGRREPIATGAAIVFPQGAGPEPRPMIFSLDEIHPIAKELRYDGSTGRPFFDVQRISLRPPEMCRAVESKQPMIVKVGARW